MRKYRSDEIYGVSHDPKTLLRSKVSIRVVPKYRYVTLRVNERSDVKNLLRTHGSQAKLRPKEIPVGSLWPQNDMTAE